MTFDVHRLAAGLEQDFPEVLFAYLFGSSKAGVIRQGGDVDVAVWIHENADKIDLIPRIVALVESITDGNPCDLVFLNGAGEQLAFEALQGHILFIRKEARDVHAAFYSQTCREYEDHIAWMKKQLQYRNYEVQWSH